MHLSILFAAALFFLLSSLGAAAAGGNPRVLLETTKGKVVLELFPDQAPKTVANFLSTARSGFYDGTIFHRVVKGFVIQGGGFTAEMLQKPVSERIHNEADNGLKNLRGTAAMARTSDPHSATVQFFINTVDNPALDHTGRTEQGWGYAVFGRVEDGMEVVEAIEALPTDARSVPTETVVILSATVLEPAD